MVTRVIHALSVSLWFGSVAFFTVAGLLLFQAFEDEARKTAADRPAWLPAVSLYDQGSPGKGFPEPLRLEQGSRAAGVAVSGIFPFYFALQTGCAVVALLTALAIGGRIRIAACVVGLAVVLAGWGLERVVHEVREPRNVKTDLALAEPSEDRLLEARMARSRFGMWHGISLLANFAALGVSATLAGLLAVPPRRDGGE
jgi:glycerol-3-phosphate acyltransferase PlsY